MIKKVKKFFKKLRLPKEVDYDDCWIITVKDKEKFLSALIKSVPGNSVWAIEGVIDPRPLTVLNRFTTNDDMPVKQATLCSFVIQPTETGTEGVWAAPARIKVLLSEANKPKILEIIKQYGPDVYVHQHFYHNKHFYFSAFDTLAHCFLSKKFDKKKLEEFVKKGYCDFEDYKQKV